MAGNILEERIDHLYEILPPRLPPHVPAIALLALRKPGMQGADHVLTRDGFPLGRGLKLRYDLFQRGGEPLVSARSQGRLQLCVQALLDIVQRFQNLLQSLDAGRLLSWLDEVGKTNQPVIVECIQGPVDQDADTFAVTKPERRAARVVLLQSPSGFKKVHRKLDHAKMMPALQAARFLDTAADRGHRRLRRRHPEVIGADPVPADDACIHLGFQESECLTNPATALLIIVWSG